MNLDYLRHLIQEVIRHGQTPKTILMSVDDAQKMGLPRWTRQLLGLKLVIAYNVEETKVVPHSYTTVNLKLDSEEEPGTKKSQLFKFQ